MEADEIVEVFNELALQTITRKLDRVRRIRIKASPLNLDIISANRYPLVGNQEVTFAAQLLVLQFGKPINEKATYIVYMNEEEPVKIIGDIYRNPELQSED